MGDAIIFICGLMFGILFTFAVTFMAGAIDSQYFYWKESRTTNVEKIVDKNLNKVVVMVVDEMVRRRLITKADRRTDIIKEDDDDDE